MKPPADNQSATAATLTMPTRSRSLRAMSDAAFLEIKQRVAALPENRRRELSAHLIHLGQHQPLWKEETARRLDAMQAGKKISLTALRNLLGNV